MGKMVVKLKCGCFSCTETNKEKENDFWHAWFLSYSFCNRTMKQRTKVVIMRDETVRMLGVVECEKRSN